MLRISRFAGSDAVTLKLEGKVVRDWVPEARRIWQEAGGAKRVVLDLFGVSFVDEPGRELLAEMHAAGVELVGGGPMISALIEEIRRGAPAARLGGLQKVGLLLFTLLLTFIQS